MPWAQVTHAHITAFAAAVSCCEPAALLAQAVPFALSKAGSQNGVHARAVSAVLPHAELPSWFRVQDTLALNYQPSM